MEQEEAEDIHHEYRRGGGAPRHVASIRSSPDESLLKIFTDAREEKKIRGRIGETREGEGGGRERESRRARRF